MTVPPVTYKRLREVLDYDPETGIFIWKVQMRGPARPGRIAGSLNKNGYRFITIDRHRHGAHQWAWFYITGQWPSSDMDHIDLRPLNNKWRNLRLATKTENMANVHARKNNACGFKGVLLHKQTGKWRARIQRGGVTYSLGLFNAPREAHAAYASAAKKLFGQFARSV